MSSWQIERSLNHQHPTHDFSRHALQAAREMGDELKAALHSAYPEREFVLDYLEEQVSFYQRGNGAPEHDAPPTKPLPDTDYCETCNGEKTYRLREQPDAEFPKADWGDCSDCGAELLLRTWEVRLIV